MRDSQNVFHLAIPCKDLDETYDFYVTKLGCKLARRYADRITLDFFGDQVVCHLDPDRVEQSPKMYPRHFGVTFREKVQYDNLLKLAHQRNVPFFQEPMTRFAGRVEEHLTFFLIDPANNLLEFKYYYDERMMY
ncbi:VOC family protein [Ferroacidibacillus organovorans]|uniref:Glyoxalase n=1 Tax=Ferroacidibacillus organovorans TaxID=1765683 RepID=A0A101XSY5_9BACL|nr:VOC family protein [Ferroacidibacillus organovorans]KUO96997.1 glyoxalase [Ferroacidibacillus organovorans]